MPNIDLMQLLDTIGGRSTPPAMGGPQPPNGTPYPLGAQGANNNAMAALAGIGMMQMMSETRKLQKAQNTVGMNLDKPTQVNPGQPGIGQADLQARAAAMASQQSPQGGPPGAPPGMPMPPPGGGGPPGMPPGGGGMPNPGMLAAMLAARGGM